MKIIIENRTDKPIESVMLNVTHVISKGLMSNNGKQYCYVTAWQDGTVVYCYKNKKSFKFIVTYVEN